MSAITQRLESRFVHGVIGVFEHFALFDKQLFL